MLAVTECPVRQACRQRIRSGPVPFVLPLPPVINRENRLRSPAEQLGVSLGCLTWFLADKSVHNEYDSLRSQSSPGYLRS